MAATITQPGGNDDAPSKLNRPNSQKNDKTRKTEERIPIYKRRHKGAPVQIRPGLARNFEPELSHKESWWRVHMKETPKPSSYGVEAADTFLKDIHRSRHTYNFKSAGRRVELQITKAGVDLLPGAYSYRDFIEEMALVVPQKSYSFKATSRSNKDFLNEGLKDRDVNVAPNKYRTESYESTCVSNPRHKNYMFKSLTQRFPSKNFTPKAGPSPCHYKPNRILSAPAISSSFRSLTPRFKSARICTPGPGMYEPTVQAPQTKTIEKMGKKYGLFFSCAYK